MHALRWQLTLARDPDAAYRRLARRVRPRGGLEARDALTLVALVAALGQAAACVLVDPGTDPRRDAGVYARAR